MTASRCSAEKVQVSSPPVQGKEGSQDEQSVSVTQSIDHPPTEVTRRFRRHDRLIAPFIPAHDLPRGAIHAVQALLGYTLMLAVM